MSRYPSLSSWRIASISLCAEKSKLTFLRQTIILVFFKHKNHIASHSNYNSNHLVLIAFLTFARSIILATSAHLWQDVFATAFPLSTLPHSPFASLDAPQKLYFCRGNPRPISFTARVAREGTILPRRYSKKSCRFLRATVTQNALPIYFFWKKYVPNLLTRKTPKNQAQFIEAKVFEKICARSLDKIAASLKRFSSG